MGSEDLDEKVQREAQRIAAAFGVEKCAVVDEGEYWSMGNWIDGEESDLFHVKVVKQTGVLFDFAVGEDNVCLVVLYDYRDASSGFWANLSEGEDSKINENMVRWLYRLGFEDADVLHEFSPLSAHEKLELRLSLPREFWPQKWLDEELT